VDRKLNRDHLLLLIEKLLILILLVVDAVAGGEGASRSRA
jgi:hypothetical protein